MTVTKYNPAVPTAEILETMDGNIPKILHVNKDSIKKLFRMDWRWYDDDSFYQPLAKHKIFDKPIITFQREEVQIAWNLLFSKDTLRDVDKIKNAENSAKKFILTSSEERALFLQFDYAKFKANPNIMPARFRMLTVKECQEAIKWGNLAKDVRDTIIVANLGLVLSMAKRYRYIDRKNSDEIIAEAFNVLMKTVDRFEAGRGFKFSTYACRGIVKSFQRTSIKNDKRDGIFRTLFNKNGELLPFEDPVEYDSDKAMYIADMQHTLKHNTANLNDDELFVIKKRFLEYNIKTNKEHTLGEIGEMIELTKERVRQVQNNALGKLQRALEPTL